MNREEKAFLANIATILVKDIGIDKKFYPKRVPNILFTETGCDEDGLELFIKQMHKKFKRKCILRKRLKEKVDFTPNKILKLHLKFKKETFEDGLFISKDTYEKLFTELNHHIPSNIQFAKTPITQHAIFSAGLIFLLSKEENLHNTLKNCEVNEKFFNKIIPYFYSGLIKEFDKYVKWPETPDEKTQTLKGFCNSDAQKLHVFGITNCKIIDVNLKKDNIIKSFVIQITCDANQFISNVEVEYADSYSFRATKINKLLLNDSANDFIPDDSYLVGSSGLPLNTKLITPFRKVSSEKEQKFNSIFEDYINISEKMFKVIFNRFQILWNLHVEDLNQFKNILKSICIIHNLCLKYKDSFNAKIQHEEKNFKQFELSDDELDMEGVTKRQEILNAII